MRTVISLFFLAALVTIVTAEGNPVVCEGGVFFGDAQSYDGNTWYDLRKDIWASAMTTELGLPTTMWIQTEQSMNSGGAHVKVIQEFGEYGYGWAALTAFHGSDEGGWYKVGHYSSPDQASAEASAAGEAYEAVENEVWFNTQSNNGNWANSANNVGWADFCYGAGYKFNCGVFVSYSGLVFDSAAQRHPQSFGRTCKRDNATVTEAIEYANDDCTLDNPEYPCNPIYQLEKVGDGDGEIFFGDCPVDIVSIESTLDSGVPFARRMGSMVKSADEIESILIEDSKRRSAIFDSEKRDTRGLDTIVLVFAPGNWNQENWSGAIEQHYEQYLEQQFGYEVVYENVDGYPRDSAVNRDAFRQQVKSVIASQYNYAISVGKTLVVHLIGDANDWEVWQDDYSWESGHPAWISWRVNYSSTHPVGGEPNQDVFPTYYEILNDRKYNTPRHVPWIASDLPYQDVVGPDGIPDVALSRWPVNSRSELLSRILLMQNYNDAYSPAQFNVLVSNVWAGDASWFSNPRMYFELDLDQVLKSMPNNYGVLRDSQWEDEELAIENAVRLNSGLDLIVMLGAYSSYYAPVGHLDDNYFSLGWLSVDSSTPYCMGISCDTGMYCRTMPSLTLHGDPVCETMGNINGKGFICNLAATAGTSAGDNAQIAVRHLEDLEAGMRECSIAEVWLTTQRAMIQESPEDRILMETLRSYTMIGDPVSHLGSRMGVIGVEQDQETPLAFDLAQNYPNPFNPQTQVSFSLDRAGLARLRVFDTRGRLVRTLVSEDLPAGAHKVTWRGDDQQGRPVSSGVYFYRLESGDQMASKRMLLVK